jgi:hypothetical protein
MFDVGTHVECVDAGPDANGMTALRRGAVYTVSAAGGYYIQLREFPPQNKLDSWWRGNRFRPLSKDRIEVFRALLVSPPKEHVEA